MCVSQQEEWLSGSLAADEPLCTVLSNNHNVHLTGKWYDDVCTETGYGFVCQKPQGRTLLTSFLYQVMHKVIGFKEGTIVLSLPARRQI